MYRKLDDGTEHTVGFHFIDRLTPREMQAAEAELKSRISRYGRIRLVLRLELSETTGPEALVGDLKFTRTYAEHIERMAIIGNREWEATWVGLISLFSGIETHYFDPSDSNAAWKWVRRSND